MNILGEISMFDFGVIGVGNMGGAIIRRGISSGVLDPNKIIIFEKHKEKVKDLIEMGVYSASDEAEVFLKSNRILLSIRPQGFVDLGKKVKGKINDNTLLISIAAGVNISKLKEIFGEQNKYVRVMSNTPALIGEAMTAIFFDDSVGEEYRQFAVELFKSIGKITVLAEDRIPAFTGFAGCMPAYIFMFIEAASDGAVSHGFSREEIYALISQALMGSAKLVMETGLHPAELKDQVTSPGGATIKGVVALEKYGFRNAIIEAINEGTKASEDLLDDN